MFVGGAYYREVVFRLLISRSLTEAVVAIKAYATPVHH